MGQIALSLHCHVRSGRMSRHGRHLRRNQVPRGGRAESLDGRKSMVGAESAERRALAASVVITVAISTKMLMLSQTSSRVTANVSRIKSVTRDENSLAKLTRLGQVNLLYTFTFVSLIPPPCPTSRMRKCTIKMQTTVRKRKKR